MSDLLYFNGINGVTGSYGLKPMTGKQLTAHILSAEGQPPDDIDALADRHNQDQDKRIRAEKEKLEAEIASLELAPETSVEEIAQLKAQLKEIKGKLPPRLGTIVVKEDVDPTDLAQTGWGILFEARNPLAPQIQEALEPLIRLRRSQTDHFQIYERGDGYRPKETAREFLERYQVRLSDPADPDRVPYYLLIVGSPEQVPFQFQYQLDVQYAVGRIDFGDDIDAYANYARSVVVVETGKVKPDPRAAFFGVANPDDWATNLATAHLVSPLYERLSAHYPHWQMNAYLRGEATKAHLLRLMADQETPAFLFTASHGMEFPPDDPNKRQPAHQGALLCQDWHGPSAWHGEIPQDFYLAGDDLAEDVSLSGLIAFFFACYGAGTPLYDEFTKQAFKERKETITERPFVAALPSAMLSLPRGGALAVIGHVERAWGSSFLGSGRSEQVTVFESAIKRLLKGQPVGLAMDYFDGRYAALSTELTTVLEETDTGDIDPYEMARLWTENNDARGYVIVGDPAVRLPTAQQGVMDKPADALFSDEDWQRTPLSVQKYILSQR